MFRSPAWDHLFGKGQVYAFVVAAEKDQGQIDQRHREPHRGEYLHVGRGVSNGPDYYLVYQHAEQEHGRYHQDEAEVGVEAQKRKAKIGGIHGDHEYFAVGEINYPHHAEYQGEPQADERVDPTQKKSVYEHLQKDHLTPTPWARLLKKALGPGGGPEAWSPPGPSEGLEIWLQPGSTSPLGSAPGVAASAG